MTASNGAALACPYSDAYAMPDDLSPPPQQPPSKAAAPPPAALPSSAAGTPAPQPPPAAAAATATMGTAAAAAAEEPHADQASPLPAPQPQHPLLYVRSSRLATLSRELPVNRRRAELVHSLAAATGLLGAADVAEATPASLEQLREYHSAEYLAALAHYRRLREGQRSALGLQDDCAPFPGLYEYAALLAGGSLHAAAALSSARYRTAVHFDGGRHHAHKSRAAGFCYVNDVVLAILQLLGTFSRVLYLDLDIHHCDAVQEAFSLTDRVLTVSLHKHAPGFFPGTGDMHSVGEGQGRGFSLNLPLADGTRDGTFVEAFKALAGGAVQLYKPDCVVLQCGVDGLAHDPIAGSWGLTPRAYAACAAQAAAWGLPLLVLGGGGYDDASAARAWVAVLAALLGQELSDDVPDHEHLDSYGPNYQIFTGPKPPLAADGNDPAAVASNCRQLLSTLQAALDGRDAGASQQPAKRARAD